MTTGGGRRLDVLLGGLTAAVLLGVFVAGLPRDFVWGDHPVYYYRILDVHGVGLEARAYSLWAHLGRPFLALAPGIHGYHAYLCVLWVAQTVALYAAARRLGAAALLAAALVFAHGLSYPLRSVGLMSSPKVLWFLGFDLLVIVFAGLERRAGVRRSLAVLLLWALLTMVHRLGILLGPAVFVGLALSHPGRRVYGVLAVIVTGGVAVAALAFVDRTSSGSAAWSFFLSHFRVEWPRSPLRGVAQVGAMALAGGTAGALALLPGFRDFLERRALAALLGLFALASVAFTIAHPSGEKAMFLLPALHCGVLAAAMMGAHAGSRRTWAAGVIAGVSVLTTLVLPPLAGAFSRVEVKASAWHDYPRCTFGLRAPRPAVDYARAILSALPPRARLQFGDWGVEPVFAHLRRLREWDPDESAGEVFYVVSPWRRLPAQTGEALPIEAVPGLPERGLMVGRVRPPE